MAEFGGFGESSSEPSVEAGEDIGLQEVPEAAAEIETVEVPTEVPDIPEETLELEPADNEGGAVESMPEDDMLEFDDSDDEAIPDIPEESLDLVSESDQLADLEEQDLTPEMNQSDTEEAFESDLDTETEVQDEGDTDFVDINDKAVSDMLEEPVSDGVELDAKDGESESGNAIEVEDPVAVGPGGIERPEISRSPERLPGIKYGRDAPPGSSPQDNATEDDDDKQPGSQLGKTDEITSNVNDILVEDKVEEELLEENNTKVSATRSESTDEVERSDTRLLYNGEPVELDPDTFEYRTESPHREFELYWDIKRAEEWAELGRQAATADSLNAAVDTTLRAIRQSKEDESTLETQAREWLRLEHGHTPYTTDVYAKVDDESESGEKELDDNVSDDENDH
jgi:hypothetical protein